MINAIHVIRVHGYSFYNQTNGCGYWRCSFCRAVLSADDCAAHVLENHPARPLVGQLALAGTGVAEVAL